MKIYVTRHGQTDMNKYNLMNGPYETPLNETGIEQAKEAREKIKNVHFDAVYTSDLQRAIITGSIIGDIPVDRVIRDPRLREVEFGKYEGKKYGWLGIPMTLFWLWPEVFPNPKSVESIASMTERAASVVKEIEQMPYENVLIACHGGIMRAVCGYLGDCKKGIMWRPHPHNCEIRVFSSVDGKHEYLEDIR